MTWRDALQTFEEQIPEATPRFVFFRPPLDALFQESRIDILYTYSPQKHTGLLHWTDERSWYVGERFVVAMELSKFCRLAMKGHSYASELLDSNEELKAHDWPPPVGQPAEVSQWLGACNAWLHALRSNSSVIAE